MTLRDCTKEELIFVIKRLQFYSLSNDHCVQRALGDVEEEREARAADMKWRKLMGFPAAPPAGKKRRAASGG